MENFDGIIEFLTVPNAKGFQPQLNNLAALQAAALKSAALKSAALKSAALKSAALKSI